LQTVINVIDILLLAILPDRKSYNTSKIRKSWT